MTNLSHGDVTQHDNTTHQTDILQFFHYPDYHTHLVLWKIFPPCIFLLGSFGNIATIFVMRRIKDQNSSQHAILIALAVSDLMVLCLSTTGGWLLKVFQVEIRNFHVVLCKIYQWLVYVTSTTSAWLVPCVTVQRTMAVLWPHRMQVMCTVQRTWMVIAALVLTACAMHFHLLLGIEFSQSNMCVLSPDWYPDKFLSIFLWFDLCMASIIPSVCLFVCNVTLSVTLFKALSSSSSITARTESNRDSRRDISYRTTVMVLAISSAFLVLTLPSCVYDIWYMHSRPYVRQQPQDLALAILVQTVVIQLWYTNSAVNFYLYCLTGTRFRKEFVTWITCGAYGSSAAPAVKETASEASKGGRHKQSVRRPLSK